MSYNKELNIYEGYIYLIINDIHPSKLYVGQTTQDPLNRWRGHVGQIKKHTFTDKLHNAMEKYGIEHFAMETIEKCEAQTKQLLIEKLDMREKYYIDLFDCFYNGYNSTKGGRNGVEHQMKAVKQFDINGNYITTYESVEKLKEVFNSVSTIYDCCSGNTKYAYGHIWRYVENDLLDFPLPTEDEKKEGMIRYYSLLPIDKYDYKGNLLKTYKNIEEAHINENVPKRELVKCCTGNKVYVGIDVYRFHHENFDTYKTYREKPKLVEQYDYDGNFIAVYESVRKAAKTLGVNYQSIAGVCSGIEKTAYGYFWKYVENDLIIPDLAHNGHCKSVYKYNRNCNLITIYPSIQEASKGEKISERTIISSCNGYKNNPFLSYTYSHTPLDAKDIKKRFKNKNCKKVFMYDLNNVLIMSFDSCNDAGKYINRKHASQMISNCCSGRKKTAYGFIWKYEKIA